MCRVCICGPETLLSLITTAWGSSISGVDNAVQALRRHYGSMKPKPGRASWLYRFDWQLMIRDRLRIVRIGFLIVGGWPKCCIDGLGLRFDSPLNDRQTSGQ